MRERKYKQIRCISESDPVAFQEKCNSILSMVIDPEIVFDNSRSFTAYITFSISKTEPESLLELYEMLEPNGERYKCRQCPYLVRIDDNKRRKWHHCGYTDEPTHLDSRACEVYYALKRQEAKGLLAEFETIPYKIE